MENRQNHRERNPEEEMRLQARDKILALMVVLTLILALTAFAACGTKVEPAGGQAVGDEAPPSVPRNTADPGDAAPATGSKELVRSNSVRSPSDSYAEDEPDTFRISDTSGTDTTSSTSATADEKPEMEGEPLELSAPGDGDTTPDTMAEADGYMQAIAPKAGEIDDNETWAEYLEFLDENAQLEAPAITNDRNRVTVRVTDPGGYPVMNATVELSNRETGKTVSQSMTYADGRAVFTTEEDLGGFQVTASLTRNGDTDQAGLEQGDPDQQVELELEQQRPDTVLLDVAFVLDSTGSMADEIDRIQATLVSIAERVGNLPVANDLRMGMVTYRDYVGDEYVTKVFKFNPDPVRFADLVEEIEAEGGDDYPEAFNRAYHETVNLLDWRDGALRLAFVIADAPPHMDYRGDQHRYDRVLEQAREAGIKTFTVASSGLDRVGEYIYRQVAQQSMGSFIFILYETPPQGEMTTPHDVGDDYSVEDLDRLIVRLITQELESTTGNEPEADTNEEQGDGQ